jgi:hypothetical protein
MAMNRLRKSFPPLAQLAFEGADQMQARVEKNNGPRMIDDIPHIFAVKFAI